jgi:hypothetical protein
MNTETGEIRDYSDLTELDKKSGKWVPLAQRDLQRLAQLETERLARLNNGVSPELVQQRLARADARRKRRTALAMCAEPSDATTKET